MQVDEGNIEALWDITETEEEEAGNWLFLKKEKAKQEIWKLKN